MNASNLLNMVFGMGNSIRTSFLTIGQNLVGNERGPFLHVQKIETKLVCSLKVVTVYNRFHKIDNFNQLTVRYCYIRPVNLHFVRFIFYIFDDDVRLTYILYIVT